MVAKDGKVLQKGKVYTIVDFGLLDIGEYQCQAINMIGDVITSSGMVYGFKRKCFFLLFYICLCVFCPEKPREVY